MKLLSTLFTVLSALGMMLAFIPLLGWLNWAVIPFTGISIILGAVFEKKNAIISSGIALIAILRLMLGGGFF